MRQWCAPGFVWRTEWASKRPTSFAIWLAWAALALTLTARGQELRTEALKIPFKVVEQLDMTFEELAQLNEVLRKVIAKATR